jgi:Glycosyl transferase family, a/b domain
VGQTEWLVPADRTLYSLRDRTGTVESPFLICASIMSKKLAAGLDALVLDVKTGSGAFLKQEAEAIHLAELMVATGNRAGTRTAALITNMSQPLGRMAGNAAEIVEAVEVLRNHRHPLTEDLRRLSLELAGWMLSLGGKVGTPEEGIQLAEELLSGGLPLKKFGCMIAAQGGDLGWFESPQWLHQPAYQHPITSPSPGLPVQRGLRPGRVGRATLRSGQDCARRSRVRTRRRRNAQEGWRSRRRRRNAVYCVSRGRRASGDCGSNPEPVFYAERPATFPIASHLPGDRLRWRSSPSEACCPALTRVPAERAQRQERCPGCCLLGCELALMSRWA